MKMTYQPKTRQRSKEHGFMKRMKTRAGRNVLKARDCWETRNREATSDVSTTATYSWWWWEAPTKG